MMKHEYHQHYAASVGHIFFFTVKLRPLLLYLLSLSPVEQVCIVYCSITQLTTGEHTSNGFLTG
jgi:hypothetical protein